MSHLEACSASGSSSENGHKSALLASGSSPPVVETKCGYCGVMFSKPRWQWRSTERRGFRHCCSQSCAAKLTKPHTIFPGQRFGRLVVIEYSHSDPGRKYRCVCDCGNETVNRQTSLHSGDTKSCGCLKIDRARELAIARNAVGNPMSGRTGTNHPNYVPIEQRIEEKLSFNPVTGCTEWMGARDVKGYGDFKLPGKHTRVHRVVWELTYGPIPSGYEIHHKCGNPPCGDIAHLECLTKAEHQARHKAQPCS